MQYIDLKPFEDFVRERNLVDEKHLSFYMHWVLRFLRSEFDRENLTEQDLLECFSDQLARDDSLQSWQARQAMQAVELYLNVFLREQENGQRSERQKSKVGNEAPAAEGESVDATPSSRTEQQQRDGGVASTVRVAAENEMDAMERMKNLLNLRHYSSRTLQTYTDWVKRYFRYAKIQKLEWISPDTVRAYLSYLATQRNVAASTQNQAFNSILFLFRETLKIDLPDIHSVRAKRSPKLPVVLAVEETSHLLSKTRGVAGLMLRLTYGAGLRISETVRLRIQDLDFCNDTLFVRSGKGDKDRTTLLPAKLVVELKSHLKSVRTLHEEDLQKEFGAVWLPGALARKYPKAPKEWNWQYVFPAGKLSIDPESGATRRHHAGEKVLRTALPNASVVADIHKHVTVHTLRHSFATHLLMQ